MTQEVRGYTTTVPVRDDQGPRDAAIDYAERHETGDAVLIVRNTHCNGGSACRVCTTRWRVEPVTTYRARPA